MGKILLAIFGISLIGGLTVYFQRSDSEEIRTTTKVQVITIQKNIAEAKETNAKSRMFHADSKEEREFYEAKADKHGLEVAETEMKREAAAEKAFAVEAKAEKQMAEMDAAVNSIDDSTFSDFE